MEKTFSWFGDRGVTLRRTGLEREYAGLVAGVTGVELVLLSAGEIPRELAAGRIHLGVTGTDLIREKLINWDQKVQELAPLGFGFADLIIAVPSCWIDVDTLDDLDAVAEAFRADHGIRLRIATKYHRLVREFLRGAEVADYQLVDSLKFLSDGLILQSQATLFLAQNVDYSQSQRETLTALYQALGL
jgi:ATP phosphoribosyltransferase